VVVIDHEITTSDAAGPISAEVGIVAFGPPNGRYGVERIAVRSSCPTAWLPSLLRRLIRGDLPTSVWWVDDLSREAPEPPIVTMGRQLVYDSRRWDDVRNGVLALAPHINERDAPAQTDRRTISESKHVDLADVNWRRLRPLRSGVVVAAEGTDAQTWRPEEVRVAHGPGEAALAWLFAGWLASRLDWPRVQPRITESADSDVLSIAIGAGTTEIRVVLDDRRVTITRGGATRSVMSVAQEGEADAVAAELHALSHDACLHDALSALLRSFRAA
jgi:glucose-6-phosphate dehydrogenase assembly protein OpcA